MEIRANAAGIPQAIANVTVVKPGTINVPATLQIHLNQTAPLAIALSTPAPFGGLTVSLSSAMPSRATISPATVFIAQGETAPAAPPVVTA